MADTCSGCGGKKKRGKCQTNGCENYTGGSGTQPANRTHQNKPLPTGNTGAFKPGQEGAYKRGDLQTGLVVDRRNSPGRKKSSRELKAEEAIANAKETARRLNSSLDEKKIKKAVGKQYSYMPTGDELPAGTTVELQNNGKYKVIRK